MLIYIHGNCLSNSVIALWVLCEDNTHGPINWFSQFFTFGYWRWLNRWSFKPYLILIQSITTFVVVNCLFLNCHRELFSSLTVQLLYHIFKERQHQNKKTVTFFCDGWYCFEIDQIWVYTISPPTHSQFVNVSQRLICVYCTLIMLIYINQFEKHQ